MAKALNFKFEDHEFSAAIVKVDRKKIYGYSKVEVKNEKGELCTLANVTSDGMHILPPGCTGIINVNSKGEIVSRTEMQVVDDNGKPIEKIPSIFDVKEIMLNPSTIEDYLSINVKSIYQLTLEDAELDELITQHQVFSFKFNYRADYQQDDAFLIKKDDTYFVVIGFSVPFEFVGLEEELVEIIVEEEEEELDFGMI